jgi:hypothetical protein
MRGNSPVRFGKRPTEKDPNHGHLAGGLFHYQVGASTIRRILPAVTDPSGAGPGHRHDLAAVPSRGSVDDAGL